MVKVYIDYKIELFLISLIFGMILYTVAIFSSSSIVLVSTEDHFLYYFIKDVLLSNDVCLVFCSHLLCALIVLKIYTLYQLV